MSRTVLITGASGALGPSLLAELLQSDGIARVVVLLRPGPRWDRRVHELRAQFSQSDRLVCVAGDVVRSDLGFGGSERERLMQDVHVVIHAAANTRFSTPAA